MSAPPIDAVSLPPVGSSAAPAEQRPSEWRVVTVLARAEARRLVLRPSMILAVALGIMLTGGPSARDVIDRAEESRSSAFSLLLLAAVP